MQDDFQLDRVADAAKRAGVCVSAYYAAAADGLMPPVVKIGARAAAVPRREIEAVNAARIAGKTDSDVRELVKGMVADRTKRFLKLTGQLDDATRQAA